MADDPDFKRASDAMPPGFQSHETGWTHPVDRRINVSNLPLCKRCGHHVMTDPEGRCYTSAGERVQNCVKCPYGCELDEQKRNGPSRCEGCGD